jgi:hypothetical protein
VYGNEAEVGDGGVAASQRVALLRRLAAGPATRSELLAAMRTAGWVGPDDLENRLRDLRASDRRSGAAGRGGGLAVTVEADRYRLADPFPVLNEADRAALAFAKAMVARIDGPLAARAVAALDGLLPGVADDAAARPAPVYAGSPRSLERFDAALRERRPVEVRYFSVNSGRERTYRLVPVSYAMAAGTLRALCVELSRDGGRLRPDKQFALHRIREVRDLVDAPQPPRAELELEREHLVLDVSDALYPVLRERDVLGIGAAVAEQHDEGGWRVTGEFPTALAWDVLEQLCGWAGSVQVHEPLWLVAAVVGRLRAGLRVVEQGEDFQTVKPEVGRVFTDLAEAVREPDAPAVRRGPRRLAPRR